MSIRSGIIAVIGLAALGLIAWIGRATAAPAASASQASVEKIYDMPKWRGDVRSDSLSTTPEHILFSGGGN